MNAVSSLERDDGNTKCVFLFWKMWNVFATTTSGVFISASRPRSAICFPSMQTSRCVFQYSRSSTSPIEATSTSCIRSAGSTRSPCKALCPNLPASFNLSFIRGLPPLYKLHTLTINILFGSTILQYIHHAFRPRDLGRVIRHTTDVRYLELAIPLYDPVDGYTPIRCTTCSDTLCRL